MEDTYGRKFLKKLELEAKAEQCSWKARVCQIEVGLKTFVGKLTTRLLKDMGI